jgi:hypothetical protein
LICVAFSSEGKKTLMICVFPAVGPVQSATNHPFFIHVVYDYILNE